MRILALKQQQQRYELRLQKLQHQQDRQGAVPPATQGSAVPPAEEPIQSAHQQAQPFLQQAAGPFSVPHEPQDSPEQTVAQAAPAISSAVSAAARPAQTQLLADQEPTAGAAASLVTEEAHKRHQQAAAACEPRYKHRHARHPVPGLSMPEIARHPFFCQHSDAGDNPADQPAAQGGPMQDNDDALHECQACCMED